MRINSPNANALRAVLPQAPFIHYQDEQLFVEQVNVRDLALEFGTPLFVYSKAAILDAVLAYQRGFEGRRFQICYAVKANSSLAILQIFARAGCGFDIVSGGELARVQAAGGDVSKVIFSGVGKTRAEMRLALEAEIACFNVESEAELMVLNEVALSLNKIAPISIRINPNIDPKTHPYISTGLKDNKFGIAHHRALAVYQKAASLKGLRVLGIDFHIGSQITQIEPFLEAVDRCLDLVQAIEAAGIAIHHLDFGGGLGINYDGNQPPKADVLCKQLLQKLDERGFGDRHLLVEPGRSLVGNAGICLSEVLYLKPSEEKNFCIIDAAMNDLPRPTLYQAFHQIVPVALTQSESASEAIYEVVGPICESGDWIGKDRLLSVNQGDFVAVLSAGAYCMSMSSQYNSRPQAAEVLVDGNQATLIRNRDSLTALYVQEMLLD